MSSFETYNTIQYSSIEARSIKFNYTVSAINNLLSSKEFTVL
jgi:hypothetical protein